MRYGKLIILSLLAMILLILSSGCSKKLKNKGFDYRIVTLFDEKVDYQFEIDSLRPGLLHNRRYRPKLVADTSFEKDSAGIYMFRFHDTLYYHPVNICHKAVNYMSCFEQSGDSACLEKALLYVDKLIADADVIDSTLYYRYPFDYKVHKKDEADLPAPWYSGMAQGEILGLLTRVFLATSDSSYLDYAHMTFKSFSRLKGEAEPWTVFIDDKDCYWIEEYPTDPPSMTLNGFIFALYGVYDYYQLTKSEEAKKVLTSSFSTLKNYIPYFRRPGHISFYGLTFRHYTFDYHRVHINQFKLLSKMTNDPFFMQWADSLTQDTKNRGIN